MEQARLIIDPPANGAWNMAVDQALLETANETGLITLRFYQWSEPTLSLGYFQKHSDRVLHQPSIECPMTRRRTGGGAILHDQELTYSLCVPSANRWSTRNADLYRLMHSILIGIINSEGASASLHEDSLPTNNSHGGNPDLPAAVSVSQDAFMCFRRRTSGDIVLGGYKVVGSAQRRSKKALLQHGSILLDASSNSPNLLGIRNLSGYALTTGETIEKCSKLVSDELQVELKDGMLAALEKVAINSAIEKMFGSSDWIQHR